MARVRGEGEARLRESGLAGIAAGQVAAHFLLLLRVE